MVKMHDHESEVCAANALTAFSEKLAFWSIGLIVLSIVLLLTLLVNGVDLSGNFWYLPLCCYLHASWFLLVVSVFLGLVARRQNAIHLLKNERKYAKDLRIINFLPVLFAVGFLLLLVFAAGSTKSAINNGLRRGDYHSYHREKMQWMMMKNLYDIKRIHHDSEQCDPAEKKEVKVEAKRKSRTR